MSKQILRKAYMPKSKNQQHLTPDKVFEIIETNWHLKRDMFYDPCPEDTPYRAPCFFNGLYGEWFDFNYVNSPFEKIVLEKFVEKSYQQSKLGKVTVMLCPTKTDQDWYHDIILKNNYQIIWIRKRLQFKNNKHHAPDTHFLVLIK